MLQVNQLTGFGAVKGRDYLCKGVNFDGSTDLDFSSADWSSPFEGDMTISLWVKPAGATTRYILGGGASGSPSEHRLYLNPDNTVEYWAGTSSPAFTVKSSVALTNGVWSHVLVTGRGSAGCKCFINGVDVSSAVTINNISFYSSFDSDNPHIGSDHGSLKYNGDMAEFWLKPVWMSNSADIVKFIADGAPVNLGATGELPFGTAAYFVLRVGATSVATDFLSNPGTENDYTADNGTITLSTTSPTD